MLPFTLETAAQEPEAFARRASGGRGRRSWQARTSASGGAGAATRRCSGSSVTRSSRSPPLAGVSSSEIRRLIHAGDLAGAAAQLGRPFELDGTVVPGDQRGGTLGYPTANLALDPALLIPPYGIYAGAARPDGTRESHRAAISIGTNPHYGGSERRIEPHLLDFEGDLYGQRLVVEVWERLRDEEVFGSESELVEQIARDVERTRAAVRPA